jgi:RNA polymerase sigma-70 factor (ECF subfamily)
MNLDHSALWNAFAAGDDEAFRQLYRLCYPELVAFGRKRTQDTERIKDAINQTFAYFWEKRESLSRVTAARSYIYTSFSRKLSGLTDSNEGILVPVDLLPDEPGDPQSSPENLLIRRKEESNLQQHIALAISKLSARKRELIRLRYYEGLKHEEICRQTGLSSRTVYNKLHESVQFLKAELQFLSPGEKDLFRLFAAM